MPQPDNKRERGKATQLPGQTVSPEGVGGIVGADGAAIGAAISSIQNAAPTQIQIGQQARVVDDGTKLFQVLQGAAVGAQKGIETYQKMYQYTSEQEYADFEADMAEQARRTGNDARKMAEWAKAHTYRPNDITAKKYNVAMAQIEGKEADVLEAEKLSFDMNKLSMMNDSDALDEVGRLLKTADPDSRYYASLAQERNRLNKSVVGTAQAVENRLYRSTVEETANQLGQQLRAAGVSPYDLSSERAHNVARMYALMGGPDNTDRITIDPTGNIQYRANDNTVHQGHFQGGITKEMSEALKADLGEFAGSLDDPSSIDTTAFNRLKTVMQHGGFNTQATSTRGASSGVGEPDPTAMLQLLSGGGSPTDVLTAMAATTGTTTDDDKQNDRIRKNFSGMVDTAIDAMSNPELHPHERNRAVDTMMTALNSDTFDAWRQFGFRSKEEFDAEMSKKGGPLDKLVEVRESSALDAIEQVSTGVAKSNDSPALRLQGARDNQRFLAMQTASAMSGVDGSIELSLVNANGDVERQFTSYSDMESNLTGSMLDSGWSLRVSPTSYDRTFGNKGSTLGESGLVWRGKAGDRPPTETLEAISAHRRLIENLKRVDEVERSMTPEGMMQQPPSPAVYNDAAEFLIGRMDPNDPIGSTDTLGRMMLNRNVGDDLRASIGTRIMSAMADPDSVNIRDMFVPSSEFVIGNPDNNIDDIAKANRMSALFNDSATRNFAVNMAAGLDGETSPDKLPRTAWEYTEGMLIRGTPYFQSMEPAQQTALLNTAWGFSGSPTARALADRNSAPLTALVTETDDQRRAESLAALQKDPTFSALAKLWKDSGQEGDFWIAAQSGDPEIRSSAIQFSDRNIRLATMREFYAKQLGGGNANNYYSADMSEEEGALQANNLIGAIIGSQDFSAWTSDRGLVPVSVADLSTTGDGGFGGHLGVASQGVRDVLTQARNQYGDQIGSDEAFAFEVLRTLKVIPDGKTKAIKLDPTSVQGLSMSGFLFGDMSVYAEIPSDEELVSQVQSFIDGSQVEGNYFTAFVRQQAALGRTRSSIGDNAMLPMASRDQIYRFQLDDPELLGNTMLAGLLARGTSVTRRPINGPGATELDYKPSYARERQFRVE